MQSMLAIFTEIGPLLTQAFVITVGWIVVLYSFSFKLGMVDHPGGRKKHHNTVPLIGGIAIFITLTICLLVNMPYTKITTTFWLICTGLVVLSALDDVFQIRPVHRFCLQFVLIGLLVVFGETEIRQIGNLLSFGGIGLGSLSLVFTCFSVVGIMNAVNMMDGIDGLTGCISLIELSGLFLLAIQIGAHNELLMIAIFMGAISAFLLFNFPSKLSKKYKIFLGDAGSILIGLTLSWLCVRLTQGNFTHVCSPVLMLWIMALPLMDALHLMIDRRQRGVSPFKADRRHVHHLLLRLNLSVRNIVFILSLSATLISSIGIILYVYGASDLCLFIGILCVFALYMRTMTWLKKRVIMERVQNNCPSLSQIAEKG